MRVVLFASAMLAAAGDALSLSTTDGGVDNHREQHPQYQLLAQTEQVPDANQLKERAAKAMEKDDKKKMGDEKFALYKKAKKIMMMKDKNSKKLAQSIEEVLAGGKADEGGSRGSSPSKQIKSDTKDQVKSAVNTIKSRLDEKDKARKEEQKKRLEEVVKTLRERMDKMKETMEKKSKIDVKKAVTQSKIAQKKVNEKIYKTMGKDVPSKMRAVIKTAI